MTDSEKIIARAIAQVTYPPATVAKSLARDMAWAAEHNPLLPLTPRQHAAIVSIAIRYRRQVPADIVALARRMEAEDRAAQGVAA